MNGGLHYKESSNLAVRPGNPGRLRKSCDLSHGQPGIELLTLAGNVIVAKYSEVKAVFFVREFDSPMILVRGRF